MGYVYHLPTKLNTSSQQVTMFEFADGEHECLEQSLLDDKEAWKIRFVCELARPICN